MTVITSRRHPIVRAFRAAAHGEDDASMLLDGWHLVTEAIAAGLPLHDVVIGAAPGTGGHAVVDRAAAAGARVLMVAPSVLDAIAPVHTSSGVVALARRPSVDAAALLEPAPALVVAVFGAQVPGNVGAIVRSAEAGGATGVLVDGHSADPFGWKALRAAMGSTFRLPVVREADILARIRAWQRGGHRVVATGARTATEFTDVDLSGPAVVLLGSEGAGLPADALRAADVVASIPMRPPVESLNLAVAAALIVYEAQRQRRARR